MEHLQVSRLSPEIEKKLRRGLELKIGGFSPVLLPSIQALQELEEFIQSVGGTVMKTHYTPHPKTGQENWWDLAKFTFPLDVESPLMPSSFDIERRIANIQRMIKENFGDDFDLSESIKIARDKQKPGIILLEPDPSIFMDEKHKTESGKFWSAMMQSRNTVIKYYKEHGVQILLPLVGENAEEKYNESYSYAPDLLSVRDMVLR